MPRKATRQVGRTGSNPAGARNLASARALKQVARLDALEQQVLVWRFGLFGQAKLSVEEIARRTNMPAGAVRVIERRAVQSLRGIGGESEVAA